MSSCLSVSAALRVRARMSQPKKERTKERRNAQSLLCGPPSPPTLSAERAVPPAAKIERRGQRPFPPPTARSNKDDPSQERSARGFFVWRRKGGGGERTKSHAGRIVDEDDRTAPARRGSMQLARSYNCRGRENTHTELPQQQKTANSRRAIQTPCEERKVVPFLCEHPR